MRGVADWWDDATSAGALHGTGRQQDRDPGGPPLWAIPAQRALKGMTMKNQLVSDTADAQVHVVILDSGEEAFSALTKFANQAKLSAASLTAIGAFEKATVGWFDFASKSYKKIEVAEQCEVLSAIGDVAVGDDGKASLHVHVVLGLADGSTRGGHLLAGTVRPTLEVVFTEVPSKLRRKKRADLGIALIDIGATWGPRATAREEMPDEQGNA
jgi:predicted DNA-binding protein with PD1-like motif